MTRINPYNFTALRSSQREPATPVARLQDDHYSGRLDIELEAHSLLITLDQRRKKRVTITVKAPNKEPRDVEIDCFPFLRRAGSPIIQGSSLRGMIRAVFESITGSCMTHSPLAVKNDSSVRRAICSDAQELCPACRLFGVIKGDALIVGSRVHIGDASLDTSDDRPGLARPPADPGFWVVKVQRLPDPGHRPIYFPDDEAAGRKFYYHHKPGMGFQAGDRASAHCTAISEIAPRGAVFKFSVSFANLAADELGALLLAIELDEGLGHKIGFAKNAGLGSCRLTVLPGSRIDRGSDRYENFDSGGIEQWRDLKADPAQHLSGREREVLRLDKHEDGQIAFLNQGEYEDNLGIDERGFYIQAGASPSPQPERQTTAPPKASDPQPANTVDAPETAAPSAVGADQEPVWLSGENSTHLWFTNVDGSQYCVTRNVFQGKQKKLVLGRWYIRQGSKQVKPLRRR